MDVKCEDVNSLPINSNDQLYHIVRADSFAFCLICLEDIINSSEDVGKHLGSENHRKNIKRLFQACNPNLTIDNDERFVDLVTRSVFDISVLLGEETCYICERDGNWFCVMCEKNVTKSNNSDTVLKDEIIDHVLSEAHVNVIKGVCFLYRFNSGKDFILLHKSVMYCSVCKDVIQCREVDLLNNALNHLKTKKHPKISKSSAHLNQTNNLVKKEANFGTQITDEVFLRNCNNSKNVFIHEVVGEVKSETIENSFFYKEELFEDRKEMFSNDDLKLNFKDSGKSFDEEQFIKGYTCTCLLCKKKVTHLKKGVVVAVDKHFCKEHHNLYSGMSLKGMMDGVIFHNKPEEMGLISKSLSIKKIVGRTRRLGRNAKFIFHTESCYFCVACMVNMPPTKDVKALLEAFQYHFDCFEHQICVEEKMKINQTVNINCSKQTVRRLLNKRKGLMEGVDKRKEKLQRKRKRKRNKLLLQRNQNKKTTTD